MKRLVLVLGCLLATGCSKYTYLSLLDGTWTGTASAQGGAALVMTANFTWDENQEIFYGDIDLDGWVYDNVLGASSDKKFAQVQLAHNAGARAVTLIDVIAEDDAMDGGFEIDTCYSATLQGTATTGQNCITPGSFNLNKQGGGGDK